MSPVEKAFVNNFVQKPRRERAIFELGSDSKRGQFLNRLCHDYLDVLDNRYLRPLSAACFDTASLRLQLRKLGAGGTCHAISSNEAADGKQVTLENALQAAVGFGLPSILICSADSLAYFEAEQEQGPPARLLLIKPRS